MSVGDGVFDEDDAFSGEVPDAPDRLWQHPSERGAALAAANMAGRNVVGRRWPAMVVSFVAGATLVGTVWLFTEPDNRPIDDIVVNEITPDTEPIIQGPIALNEWEIDVSKENVDAVVGLYLTGETTNDTAQAFLFRSDGHLITSAHGIAGAIEITAMMADGQKLPATIVATDSVSGVAVLKVNTPEVEPVGWYEGSVNVQDRLVGIATQAEDGRAIVQSIDLLNRDQVTSMPNTDMLSGLFRLSSGLEGSWSGSPIVNEHGGVVAMAVTSAEGNNYAIPAQRLRRVAEDLIANQATDHKAWIGVHMAAGLTPDVMESRGIRGGVLITRVFNGTPADRAGLSAGDVVIGVDGFDVNATSDLAQALRTGEPGDEITIRYSRLVPPDLTNITKNDPEAYEPETFLAVVTLGAQPIV